MDTREPCWPSAPRYGVRRLRADDGIRTRDPHLGKVMLYQLSHVRMTPRRRANPPPTRMSRVQNCSRSWRVSKLAPAVLALGGPGRGRHRTFAADSHAPRALDIAENAYSIRRIPQLYGVELEPESGPGGAGLTGGRPGPARAEGLRG